MSQTFDQLAGQYAQQGGVTSVFSLKVADYLASRPDYPAALLDTLDATLGGDQKVIADVGAGTGLLTRDLLARGHRVIAVEPNAEMRDACDHLLGTHPQYQSVNATAESMPFDHESVDLITAATAFHWFDIPRAKAECLRVLKPDGFVALIWNDRVLADPFHIAFDEIAAEFGGVKRNALLAHEGWEKTAEFFGAAKAELFAWPHQHLLTKAGVASLLFSRSYIPPRDSEAGQRVVRATDELFDRFAQDSEVLIRYTTVAHIGRPI